MAMMCYQQQRGVDASGGTYRHAGTSRYHTGTLFAVVAALACTAMLRAADPPAPAGRLNIVWIVADDHSADVYGAYGSTLARTPNLDRFASQGLRFDRAFVNAPYCTASRQSFLTGRYPHAVGVTLLRQALPDTAYTLAHRLREAGYRTGAFGKMHFNAPLLHGFEVHVSERDGQERIRQGASRPLPEDLEVFGPWRPFQDHARVWLNSDSRPLPLYDQDMPDSLYAREAIKFMDVHRDEPFFVQIGFHEPHSPYWFPVELAGSRQREEFPVPTPGPEDAFQIPAIFVDLTDAEKQGIMASYYTSVAFLDRKVGEVLDAIDRMGLAGNTLVCYFGDHGYHLGEHGRFEKHCLYERIVRTPLVMRLPGAIKAGSATEALVEFVDLVPTMLDYARVRHDAGTPPPRDLHGRSLRPLLEGRTDRFRDDVFCEYQHTEEAMIRTARHKLIYRTRKALTDWYTPVETPPGGTVRLYDLQADPQEMHNVSGDPANAELIDRLLDRLADRYRAFPPLGKPAPDELSRQDFLDWAIAARELDP